MASIKFSVDCSLCPDPSVKGVSASVKCFDSWLVVDPQKETMGHIGMLCLCSFNRHTAWVDAEHYTSVCCSIESRSCPLFSVLAGCC